MNEKCSAFKIENQQEFHTKNDKNMWFLKTEWELGGGDVHQMLTLAEWGWGQKMMTS